MSFKLQAEIFYIEMWHLIFLTLSILIITLIYNRSSKTELLYAFLVLQFTNVGWMISKILKTVAFTIELRWFFILTQYFSICALEVAFINFAYCYLKRKKLSNKVLMILSTIAFLQFSLILTNPLHYKFYSFYTFRGDEFGPFFYIHFALQYISVIVGIIFCAIGFSRDLKHHNKLYVFGMSIAILGPTIFNILYVTKVIQNILFSIFDLNIVFDVTPIAFSISLFIFYYVIHKEAFLDRLPLIESELADEIETGFVIINGQHKVLEFNPYAYNVLKISHGENIRSYFKKHFPDYLDHIQYREIFELDIDEHVFEFVIRPYGQNFHGGYCIIIKDITDFAIIRDELEIQSSDIHDSNLKLTHQIQNIKETARLNAISEISGRLHDHLGHSMTVAIKLFEVILIEAKQTGELNQEKVTNGLELLMQSSDAFQTIDASQDDLSFNEELVLLSKELELSNINFKYYLPDILLTRKQVSFLVRFVKESTTNSIKHGHANEIVLFVKTDNQMINLHLMDNGIGTKKLKPGNGLSFMTEQVKKLNGSINWTHEKNEGFQTFVSIPI